MSTPQDPDHPNRLRPDTPWEVTEEWAEQQIVWWDADGNLADAWHLRRLLIEARAALDAKTKVGLAVQELRRIAEVLRQAEAEADGAVIPEVTNKVRREMCETCIFRPGNLMDLTPGRLANMVREAEEADAYITCHETLETVTGTRKTEAMCRGYLDTGRTPQMYRIAERLDMLEEV